MERYPHVLEIPSPGELEVDEDGFPIANSEPGDSVLYECRETPNSSGSIVNTEAGEKIVFGSKIFLPQGTPSIPHGTEIRVLEKDGTVRISGRVIRFTKYQLGSIIWV